MARTLVLASALLAAACFAGAASAHDDAYAKPSAPPSGAAAFAFTLPEPGSYRLPPIRAAAGGQVLAEDGSRIDLAALLRGSITVFSFIYTRCADICPDATMRLADLRERARRYPALGDGLRLVSMSFDPSHDTPSVMRDYGALWRTSGDGGAEWRFLTAAGRPQLAPILAAYDQAVAPVDPKDPTGGLDHILRVFLIDRAGQIRNVYSMDFLDPELVLTDILTLAGESAGD
ncbi:SCO family protein [Mesorhizobium sp. KR9-304]|uniref:SCO family protein n=1 Tax=Mesorhizobium sp. KR9-304 TaxID=3156614 RepID=UPI0032B4065E